MAGNDETPEHLAGLPDDFVRSLVASGEESDRGLLLALVGEIDDRLDALIRRMGKPETAQRETLDRLLDVRANGPLSPLGVRLNLAYGMGWIAENTYRRARTLKELRNTAAHSIGPFSLVGNRDVKDKLAALVKATIEDDAVRKNTFGLKEMAESLRGIVEYQMGNIHRQADELEARVHLLCLSSACLLEIKTAIDVGGASASEPKAGSRRPRRSGRSK